MHGCDWAMGCHQFETGKLGFYFATSSLERNHLAWSDDFDDELESKKAFIEATKNYNATFPDDQQELPPGTHANIAAVLSNTELSEADRNNILTSYLSSQYSNLSGSHVIGEGTTAAESPDKPEVGAPALGGVRSITVTQKMVYRVKDENTGKYRTVTE